MHALFALTVANIRSFVRDRAALFWTLAFPLVFIVLFGLIFQSSGTNLTLGYVDQDGTPAATQLYDTFTKVPGVKMVVTDATDATNQMKTGKVDGVVLVPAGYEAGLTAASTGGAPAMVTVSTDPSRPQLSASVYQVVAGVLGVVNLGGHPPLVGPRRRDGADREPQRDQLLRAEHARAVDHAGRASSPRSRSSATARS